MNATVDRDDILALSAVSVLLQGYLRAYEWEYGIIPRAREGLDHDQDRWPLVLADVKQWALEHARSDAMRPTREFNSNCSPEECAAIFPLSCIFGAVRTRFTRIEPKLRALGGWTRGVPLHRIHQQGHPQEAAIRASGLPHHEVFDYAKRGEGEHPRILQPQFSPAAQSDVCGPRSSHLRQAAALQVMRIRRTSNLQESAAGRGDDLPLRSVHPLRCQLHIGA